MAGQEVLKGRKAYTEVTAALQRLTVMSPQPQGTTARFQFQAGKEDAGASCPLNESHALANWHQGYDDGEIVSEESYQGFQLHGTSPAASREFINEANGIEHGRVFEETKLSSLPATVVETLEERSQQENSSCEEVFSQTAETQSIFSDSQPPIDSSEKKTDESSGSSSLPWIPNVPNLEFIMPSAQCTSSSDAQASSSTSDNSRPDSDNAAAEEVELGMNVNLRQVALTIGQLNQSLRGFLFGSKQNLQDFLNKIVSSERDFGFYVFDQLKPSHVDKVMCYRPHKEFHILKTIHKLENDCGVFICRDARTKHHFVLKKIMKNNQRLVGIEFLTQHNQDFLPQIYGVYKEEETISFFEEYIEGGTLMQTNWNLAEIRKFAEVLLSAVHYLHSHDLVHFDIKLRNLMVRDPSRPESLVLIDFESAKLPMYPFNTKGYTLTYLPPWYDKLLNLERYDPVLKTADLWAVACVIIFFLIPSERSGLEKQGRGVWSQKMREIQNKCHLCRKTSVGTYCSACRAAFLKHLKDEGHEILDLHLGKEMDKDTDNPDKKALLDVLKYLTNPNNIEEKHVHIALHIIRGPVHQQPAIEFDQDIS
ncbi:uncharacterized protein LOC143295495 [Babylonia areolata]|uniref:uncharacterized protein LOC143295495 n=1 Tax=Babylonia areolata TaxID=304850 RepID=UPI003FD2C43C